MQPSRPVDGTARPLSGTKPLGQSSPRGDARGETGIDLVQERALVARASRGETEAVGLLYDAYVTQVYRYCLGRVRHPADAEDLTEEIFLKVIGAIEGFEWRVLGESERSPFRAWVFRIAHNHVVSFHRRAAARGPSVELSETLHDDRRGPQDLTETKIAIEEVMEVVRQLPDAQRDVILLRFVSGLSVAETAAALDKQQTNVKVLQHKGVQRLKRLLGAAEDAALEQQDIEDAPIPLRQFRSAGRGR
ncbi:MAG: sigma-70 family RNA polymerase sigma factor [Dehalococcoidia bacterium]|nr:sigma-70 family RNA polymerase sigma factor [Dehalococcoidia bacterium]